MYANNNIMHLKDERKSTLEWQDVCMDTGTEKTVFSIQQAKQYRELNGITFVARRSKSRFKFWG